MGALRDKGPFKASNKDNDNKEKTMNTKKETANVRRERLAKALETAYNEGGDYDSVIREIKSYGDGFKGQLRIKADGVYQTHNGEGNWLKVMNALPQKPSASGWEVKLFYVRVFFNS